MKRPRTPAARPFDDEAFDQPVPQVMWVSEGIVTGGNEGGSCVQFDTEDGMPLVFVTLEPSKHLVQARVGAASAGAGEGEWSPFIVGDHVLVTFPNGSLRRGIITSRLNNSLDSFPFESVAGQDARKNNFAFRRRRTPVIEEFAGPVIFRQATTGALFSIDRTGTVTIRDGEGAALQMSQDAITLQGPSSPTSSPRFIFQAALGDTNERATLQIGSTIFSIPSERALDSSAYLALPGTFTLGFGLNAPIEHVATVEFVVAILDALSRVITPLGGGDPTNGGVIATALQALISTGQTAITPAWATALQSGFAIASQVPKLPVPGVQLLPGLGAVNFLTG